MLSLVVLSNLNRCDLFLSGGTSVSGREDDPHDLFGRRKP